MTARTNTTCRTCGTPLPVEHRRGRPRVYCTSCVPDKGAAGRIWRAANPDSVAQYNAARRVAMPAQECERCHGTFTPRHRPARFCSERCRGAFRDYGPLP